MILVAGATGSLGGRIVRELVKHGHPVRALVRPSSQPAVFEEGVDIVAGDLASGDGLDRACAGVRTVITTASASRRGGSIEDVDRLGNAKLIDAAGRAGVERFLFTSTMLASDDSPVPLFRAKAASEARLKSSGMTWTVLRANAFMDVWFGMLIEAPLRSGQPVTLVGELRRRHSFVAEQDVAAFALASVDHPAAANASIDLGGPQAVTFRDVIRAYEEAAGRPIAMRTIPAGDPIPGLPDLVSSMAAALDSFDSPVPMEDTARTFGVTPTDVRSFARGRMTVAPL